MKPFFTFIFLAFISTVFAQQKKVCITIDDLPAVTNGIEGNDIRNQITEGIVKTLKEYNARAIGYVNEGKLYQDGVLDSSRVQMLESWLKHGQELGNHSYSHFNYDNVGYKQFTQSILRGEEVCKTLAAKYDSQIKYFRHPYLRMGQTRGSADSLSRFLKDNGYIEAPVTIDNDDYLFAAAYTRAYRKDDAELVDRISKDYLDYMEKKLVFFEEKSVELYGRPIAQTLLIHANLLNAHYLDKLLDIYQKHDYGFVSQTEVLTDAAYDQQIYIFGAYGISWIKRWALSQGKTYKYFQDDPRVPDYINN